MNIAIVGDRRLTLPPKWAKETLLKFLSDTHIDASMGASPEASLTIIGLFGDTTVYIPPGSTITTSGFTIFGDQKTELVGSGSGPHIRLRSFGAFMDIRVVEGPPLQQPQR